MEKKPGSTAGPDGTVNWDGPADVDVIVVSIGTPAGAYPILGMCAASPASSDPEEE